MKAGTLCIILPTSAHVMHATPAWLGQAAGPCVND